MTARKIRELCETTRQHGELLVAIVEQLGGLTGQVGQITTRHTDLAAAVSEDLAPTVGALHQRLRMRAGSPRWAARTWGWRALALRQHRYCCSLAGQYHLVGVLRGAHDEGAQRSPVAPRPPRTRIEARLAA